MTTYCEDTDILAEDRTASRLLDPALDLAGSWERHREAVYAEINRNLEKREPPIDGGAGLLMCEVYGVLARAYMEQASTPDDLFWARGKDYRSRMMSELTGYRGESGDPGSIFGIPVWRS